MVRLIVFTLFVFNLVILAGVALQRAAGAGDPIVISMPADEEQEVARLMLASELPQPMRPIPEPAEPEPAIRQCFTLGPFESLADAELMRPTLEPMTSFVATRETVIQYDVGHWVYVPPLESRAAAIAVTEQLNQADYGEYFIVPNGDLARAISLGMFRREQGAQARKAEIDALGLDVDVLIALETKSVPARWTCNSPTRAPKSPGRTSWKPTKASPGRNPPARLKPRKSPDNPL